MVKKSEIMSYLKLGLSVIPCSRYKVPMIKTWKEYQERLATEQEVDGWIEQFKEIPAIAMITGELSKIFTIDIDIPYITIDDIYNNNNYILIRDILGQNDRNNDRILSRTPRGGLHIWTKFPVGSNLRNSASKIYPNVDIRGEGGYFLVPPSSAYDKDLLKQGIKKLGRYTFEGLIGTLTENLKIISEIPVASQEIIKSVILVQQSGNKSATLMTGTQQVQQRTDLFQEGKNRDDNLFQVGMALLDGNCNHTLAEETIYRLALSCNFPENEAKMKVVNCLNRTERKIENITAEIKEFIEEASGWFLNKDLYHAFNLNDPANQKKIRSILSRMVKANELEKHKTVNGKYRKVENTLDRLDPNKEMGEDFKLWMPLNIHNLVRIHPKNLIVVAGVSNTGKTTFMMDLARVNRGNHKIMYFSNEMGEFELKEKMLDFGGVDKFDGVEFYERTDNFEDVIDPDGINIIDFLEINENHYFIGEHFKRIHEKLNTGICFIAIQKKTGSDYGVGGAVTLNKPRLYINLDEDKARNVMHAKIIKAKHRKHKNINPNYMECDYWIVNSGTSLEGKTSWNKEGTHDTFDSDNKPFLGVETHEKKTGLEWAINNKGV